MSNNSAKAVTTLILAAAAVSIGYRIATSPERRSRTSTPNPEMKPRTRRNVKSFEPEDAILTPETNKQTRRRLKSFESEDEILAPERPGRVAKVPSNSSRLSRRRDREDSVEIKQESDDESVVSERRPASSSSSRPPSHRTTSAKSRSRSLSRGRRSASRGLPELRQGVRNRIGRCLGLSRDEHVAYCLGIVFFVVAIVMMTGVDRLHEAQRARTPSTITSILFVRPIETYISLQRDLEALNGNVAKSAAKVERFAKLVPKCTWHDIKDTDSMDQCSYDGLVHEVRIELVKTKLRSLILVGKEVNRICQTLSSLESDLEQAGNNQHIADSAVKRLIAEREEHALAIVNATNIDNKRISGIYSKLTTLLNLPDKFEGAIPKTGQFANPDLLEDKLKEIAYHLSDVHESLDLSPSTELGCTQENVIDQTMRLANIFGDMHRWLVGREVEASKLEKQLQVARQEPLIRRACDEFQHEVQEVDVVPGEKPLISWAALRKDALCERFCG